MSENGQERSERRGTRSDLRHPAWCAQAWCTADPPPLSWMATFPAAWGGRSAPTLVDLSGGSAVTTMEQ
jgi:hypothetical protein